MSVNRAQLTSGLSLIILGISILLAQYFAFGPGVFLTMLALVFLIPYTLTHSYSLLIPGCVLAGIGLGLLFGRALARPDTAVAIGLGLSFIVIYIVQAFIAGESHWWPLIPGGILVLVGLAETVPDMQPVIERGWPIVLILIGLGIVSQIVRGMSSAQDIGRPS